MLSVLWRAIVFVAIILMFGFLVVYGHTRSAEIAWPGLFIVALCIAMTFTPGAYFEFVGFGFAEYKNDSNLDHRLVFITAILTTIAIAPWY